MAMKAGEVPEQLLFLRTSEKSNWQACRQMWWWAYVEKLKPYRTKSPLFFGDLAHQALEAWYIPGKKRGVHPAETFERLWLEHLRAGGEEIMVGELTCGELGVEMMENYVDQWEDDEWMEVVHPEMTFQVNVFDKNGKYLFTYVGTIDGVIRDLRNGKIGFLEHKTGASLEPFGAPLALDEQNGAYWTYAPFMLRDMGILGPHEWPYFMMYNRLRKSAADKRPRNEDGIYLNSPSKDSLLLAAHELIPDLPKSTKVSELKEILEDEGVDWGLLGEPSLSQPPPLFKREMVMRTNGDRRTIMHRTEAIAREMRLVKAGKLDVYKQPGKHCTYCDFRDMCEVHETGSDWESLRDEMYHEWSPYDAHEIAMEGKL